MAANRLSTASTDIRHFEVLRPVAVSGSSAAVAVGRGTGVIHGLSQVAVIGQVAIGLDGRPLKGAHPTSKLPMPVETTQERLMDVLTRTFVPGAASGALG